MNWSPWAKRLSRDRMSFTVSPISVETLGREETVKGNKFNHTSTSNTWRMTGNNWCQKTALSNCKIGAWLLPLCVHGMNHVFNNVISVSENTCMNNTSDSTIVSSSSKQASLWWPLYLLLMCWQSSWIWCNVDLHAVFEWAPPAVADQARCTCSMFMQSSSRQRCTTCALWRSFSTSTCTSWGSAPFWTRPDFSVGWNPCSRSTRSSWAASKPARVQVRRTDRQTCTRLQSLRIFLFPRWD